MPLIIYKIQLKEVFFVASYLLRFVEYPLFDAIQSKCYQSLPRNPNIHLSITLPFQVGSSEETFSKDVPHKNSAPIAFFPSLSPNIFFCHLQYWTKMEMADIAVTL